MKKRFLALSLAMAMMLSLSSCSNSSGPAASGSAASSASPSNDTVYITWATASLGGTVQMVASAISTVINKYEANYKVTVQATGGSVENVRLLANNECDIAHTTEGVNGFRGTGSFSGEPGVTKMMTLVKLYGNEMVALVMDKSKLTDTKSLEGLKVCIGPTGSGISQMATAYLKALGVLDKCSVLNISYNDSVDALKDGTIDVLFAFTSGKMPNSYLTQLETSATVRALPLETDLFDGIYAEQPDFGPATLPVGSLQCITAEYPTFASYSLQFVDNRMSEEVAYTIVKDIYENYDELCVYNNSCKALTIDGAMEGMPLEIPVHPGAAKYLKEAGVWNDAYTIGTLD
ncbi:MAG: TAXI family TRAP transporter solute-binding subunit [Lawsonibacter sp.]